MQVSNETSGTTLPCPKCGQKLESGWKCCPCCGAEVASESASESKSTEKAPRATKLAPSGTVTRKAVVRKSGVKHTKKCPHCGFETSQGGAKCPSCNMSFNPKATSGKGLKIAIVGGIAALLIVVGLFALGCYRYSSTEVVQGLVGEMCEARLGTSHDNLSNMSLKEVAPTRFVGTAVVSGGGYQGLQLTLNVTIEEEGFTDKIAVEIVDAVDRIGCHVLFLDQRYKRREVSLWEKSLQGLKSF